MEEYRDKIFEVEYAWNLHLDYLLTPEALLVILDGVLAKVTNRREREFKTGQVVKNLAGKTSPDFLLALFRRYAKDRTYMDFLYRVAQEMVVKGLPVSTYNEVRSFYEWNRYSQHPLAALPLHLTVLETHLGRSSLHSEFGGSLQGPRKDYPNKATGTPEELKQILTVMLCWASPPEANIFEFDQPITAEDLAGSLLLSLNLECLADTPAGKVNVESASAADILDRLYGCSAQATYFYSFDAGANRLKAWESLAGLVGYPGLALPTPELTTLAEQTTWLMFVAENKWFEMYWSDLGIAALRPGGKELAVLAGTDSD